jgi:putative transcriptional regulator
VFPIALKRAAFALAAMLLPATLIAAVPSGPGDIAPANSPKFASLAGQVLIATPAMRDPRFERSVILVVRHNKDGAFGIVINRPVGERSLASLLAAFGDKDATANDKVRIFLGGPVQTEVGFVIHSTDYRIVETMTVDANIAVTSSAKVLRDIADKKGPAKSLVAFGYAGWAPRQLEGELEHNAWYTGPQTPGLVFDLDRDKVWDDATAHRTQDL